MSDVNETLQQLVQRRMRELGGSNGPLPTRQLHLRGGEDRWSYETVRKIVELGHYRIGDKVADTLSIALDTPVSQILAAAGQRPRLGRFELPRRADRLSESERSAILGVVDAILSAGEGTNRASPADVADAIARGRRSTPIDPPKTPPRGTRLGDSSPG